MTHYFDCFYQDQQMAVEEFNEAREKLEEMHQSKIKVLGMYKPFIGGWRVAYILENED